jgi:pimeloyl-ACP methyl ester carboxylesterase
MFAVLLILALLGGGWAWTPDLDRATLEARYATPPSQFVAVSGLRLHVRDTGPRDAPALVLLHGFGASLLTWEPWTQELQQQFRVIRIDLPGSGLSSGDPAKNYSDERAVQILLALMDQLGVQRASFVGHSMGGRIAWRFAADQPQRVNRLVLLAPDGFASPGFEYGKAVEVGPGLRLMERMLPRVLIRLNLEPAYANPKLVTDAVVDQYWDLIRVPGLRGALLDRLAGWVPQDPRARLAQIQAPTLLLWGDKDAMIPVANAQDFLKAIAGSKLVTLNSVGHLPQEEAPAAALPPVREFLLQP